MATYVFRVTTPSEMENKDSEYAEWRIRDNTFGEQAFWVRTLENTLDSEDLVEEERLGLVFYQALE